MCTTVNIASVTGTLRSALAGSIRSELTCIAGQYRLQNVEEVLAESCALQQATFAALAFYSKA